MSGFKQRRTVAPPGGNIRVVFKNHHSKDVDATSQLRVRSFKSDKNIKTRSPCTPATATTYDIDNEHAYIMAKALRSYREFRRREITRPPGLLRRYIKSAGSVSRTGDAGSDGGGDDADRPKPECIPPTRDRRCVKATVGPPLTEGGPLMLVMTRRIRPRTAGGFHVAASRVDAIGQVGMANAAREPRPAGSRWMQTTSVAWPFSMDKIGEKERGPSRYQCESTCFASTSSPRKSFTIHPDWVSENLTVAKINLKERTGSVPQCDMTRSVRSPLGITGYPMRRCASAPPARRNPITWEYS